MNLFEIESPEFIKKLKKKELISLASDIRSFLIENISKTGGHLSSNLGLVELTMAMHYVFSSPEDKLIFDVGHQCYTHKILTGRAKDFVSLRKYKGLSGFISKDESIHDIFESGHSSTSLSAQCGYLIGGNNNKVVALIGDASIANGVSFEALNHMGTMKDKAPIIILNDNKMSISSSVGSISRIFSKLRSTGFYQKLNNGIAKITPRFIRSFFHKLKNSIKGFVLKENIFEDFGFDYMGPFDGNDVNLCIKILNSAKKLNKPCIVHFVTKKGKGYLPSEKDNLGNYHSVAPFDVETGEQIKQFEDKVTFANVVGDHLLKMVREQNYYVISPAMIKGSELEPIQKEFPNNILDVGIAEEHATVLSSAMAQNNNKVILMMYSTFAQRAYDFVLNDIARTNTNVIIGIDRADFVPGDGSTHQGIYDISMFNVMPNVQILAPRDSKEVCALFNYASKQNAPVVIRYPKDYTSKDYHQYQEIDKPSWELVKEGKDLYVLCYGRNVDYVLSSIEGLDIDVGVINTRFIKPMDEEMLHKILLTGKPILLYENCVSNGGLSSLIYRYMNEHNLFTKFKVMGLNENDIVPVGDLESLRKEFNLSKDNIREQIKILCQ